MAQDASYLDDCTVGVAMNLCGCILVNGGTNCMKLGIVLREADRGWRHAWYLGGLGFAVGNVLNFISLGMAPQSLLACVGASQFLTNLLFARLLLGEVVSMRACVATAVIISGTLIAVQSAPHRSPKPTVDDMTGYYFRPEFQAYAAAVLTLIVALEVAFRKAPVQAFYRPLCYCATSAMVGTFSVVQGKCLAVLITEMHDSRARGSSVRVMRLVTLAVLLLVACQAFWLTRMQRALGLFNASVIPLLQVCWTTFSILAGGIFFCELETLPSDRLIFFAIGLVVMMSGVYLLLPAPSQEVLRGPEPSNTFIYNVINCRRPAFLTVCEFHDSIVEAAAARTGNSFSGRSFASRNLAAPDEELGYKCASDDEPCAADTIADSHR